MKVKNNSTQGWDTITLGSVTIDNSLSGDSATHGASVHAVNQGLAGKISGDGSVEKVVKSTTTPSGTEATLWIEPDDFTNAETAILKDTLVDEDLDKAPTVHAVKQAIDNIDNIDYDSIPSQGRIEYAGPSYITPTGYTKTQIPYDLNELGGIASRLDNQMNYPAAGKEQIVGYWINGKPIYRKVLEGTTGSKASTWTTIGTINDIDEITSLTGILGKYLPIPQYVNSSYLVSLQNNNGNIQGFAVGYLSTPVKIIVEYTKTTDSTVEVSEVQ